ncbi:MAG: 2-amino-4-hydroxy-6-hydroxymethyldihydropteridine diphosphokinase [Chitinophagaceae bacterium]
MNKAYLLIGGNMGDRLANLEMAKLAIHQEIGSILLSSSMYETAAWGKEDQPAFLNQALLIETNLIAHDLMMALLAIEKNMGRIRQEHLGPRTIDLDIIFFNDQIIDSANLTIPHPQMQKRNFVLTPLKEIAPNFIHPILKKSITQLLTDCEDPLLCIKK